MTGTSVAVILVCLAVIVALLVFGWRALDLRNDRQSNAQAIEIQRLAQERDRANRELALKEREVAITERRSPTLTPPDLSTFPKDLLAMANNESEEWARDDAQAVIAEAYLETGGDWTRAANYVGSRVMSQRESRLPKHLLS